MKLYCVLLLFFFTCAILFVGVVSDISAAVGQDGPYTAEAYGYRVGGINNNRLNVSLSGRASSTVFGSDGYYKIELFKELPSGWSIIAKQDNVDTHGGPIDGHFYAKLDLDLPREEYACHISVGVGGRATNGRHCFANADEYVGPMPPPPPNPPLIIDPEPQVGISSVDPDATPYPGNTYEFRLITDVHYYWVDWYVKAPWETSERGTHIEGQLGDGETTESTFSYTFPSGAMHTGDFLITAVIYRGTDMSQYEETYTVTVSLE